MNYTRTQVYLPPSEYRDLKEEAKRLNISLAELLRQLVHQYLDKKVKPTLTKKDYLGIVGLGTSGKSDVSEKHDQYLGEAIARENIR